MNTVDTSKERVAKGWQMIEAEFELQDLPEQSRESVSQSVEGEHISANDSDSGEASDYAPVMSDAERAEKEADMSAVIVQGLTMTFAALRINHVPDGVKQDFANSWAVVIVKRFPDNPVGNFYKEYKDLIIAGSSTLVLIGAIRESKIIDREKANKVVDSSMRKAQAEAEE